jgi:hypothetical protein
MIELQKTDPTCSNIYLIDENECLSKSLSTINTNVVTLSSNLNSLSVNLDKWNQIYSFYSQNSSKVLNTVLNVHTLNSAYNKSVDVVQTLSASNWNKQFSLYYPAIIGINDWYNDITQDGNTNADQILRPWLTNNFPEVDYVDGQIVNIYVTLSQEIPFYFQFSRSYRETCSPQGAGAKVTCTAPNDPRYQGCNITGVGCTNAYSYCLKSLDANVTSKYYCKGYGAATLVIDTENPQQPKQPDITPYTHSFDKTTARILQYRFVNNSSTWTIKL